MSLHDYKAEIMNRERLLRQLFHIADLDGQALLIRTEKGEYRAVSLRHAKIDFNEGWVEEQ